MKRNASWRSPKYCLMKIVKSRPRLHVRARPHDDFISTRLDSKVLLCIAIVHMCGRASGSLPLRVFFRRCKKRAEWLACAKSVCGAASSREPWSRKKLSTSASHKAASASRVTTGERARFERAPRKIGFVVVSGARGAKIDAIYDKCILSFWYTRTVCPRTTAIALLTTDPATKSESSLAPA